MGRTCSTHGAKRGMHIGFLLESQKERKRPLGRSKHRSMDNIKMDLREIGYWGGMDWINLAQDRDR
jgi:hypothetical protein